MPRSVGTVVENNFIKGLITETTALQFPPNACTDALNVDFDLTGRVSKRSGIDLETAWKGIGTDVTVGEAITEYVWSAVAGDGTKALFVLQKGRYLYFFEASDSADISPTYLPTLTIDLNTYKPASTDQIPAQNPCGYTSGNGDLIVVNQACNPIYIFYTAATGALTVTALTLTIRDFRGLNDGLAIDNRPTATVAGLISAAPLHYYNLANQGWLAGDSLSQWDTALTTMPSNCDYIGLFRSSATDGFDSAIVTSKTGYNTPAPKGHYTLDAFQPDRTLSGTLTFSGTVAYPQLIDDTGLTRIGDTTSSYLYDGLTAVTSSGACVALATDTAWFGNNLGSAMKISKAIIYGSNNKGYNQFPSGGGFFVFCAAAGGAFTAYLYGNTAAPGSATDGTLLGTTSFTSGTDESGGREIFSTDTTNTYQYVWVYLVWTSYAAGAGSVCTRTMFISEMDTYKYVLTSVAASDDIVTYKRPTTTAFYQGRIFYSGVVETNLGSNIYFSQIAEKRDQYGLCYQKNDPTSEDLPDLLADDGGLIKIPDAGNIIKLWEFQGALLALATNGVWLLQGSGGSPFLATAYEVKKISSSGTNSPLSIASFRGVPVWWGREGIMTVNYDANYGSFSVDNITNTTIQSLIDAVPNVNKKYVKGACDPINRLIYWLYNDSANLLSTDIYIFNKILVLNMQTGAFAPYDYTAGPKIRGITWIPDNATSSNPAKIKFTTSISVTSGSSTVYDEITFSDLNSAESSDWATYAIGVPTAISYTSFTKRNDATTNATAGYDGTTNQAKSACVTKTNATSLYYGFSFVTATNVERVNFWGSNDAGYVNGANPTITATLYGKTGAAPGSGTDGTALGSISFTDSADEHLLRREIISTDPTSTWDHTWIYILQSGAAATMYLAEAEFYKRVADSTQESDYDAYFTTGYRLDGQSQRFFQSNYVMVFFETVDTASCFGRGIFDFTNSSNSGKWSTSQQLYDPEMTNSDVNYKKLKIRGKGRALQLEFTGEAGLPFTIIGWNIWVTGNAGV